LCEMPMIKSPISFLSPNYVPVFGMWRSTIVEVLLDTDNLMHEKPVKVLFKPGLANVTKSYCTVVHCTYDSFAVIARHSARSEREIAFRGPI
jgi:hypothetical protein